MNVLFDEEFIKKEFKVRDNKNFRDAYAVLDEIKIGFRMQHS